MERHGFFSVCNSLTKTKDSNARTCALCLSAVNRWFSSSAHITDALASFHWLWVAERIKFKLAVIVYRAIHSTAPQYMSDMLRRFADIPSRSHLRSSTSSHLVVRPSRLVTVRERLFASAGLRLWNSLPERYYLLRHNHYQRFEENWKLTYFGNLTQTLYCSFRLFLPWWS